MYIGIYDNVDRDVEWCGVVVEFMFVGKVDIFIILCVVCYLQVQIFFYFFLF